MNTPKDAITDDLAVRYSALAELYRQLETQLDDATAARIAAERERDELRGLDITLNVKHPHCHEAADAFWKYWEENGVPHKHGYYESTWGAINAALRTTGIVHWRKP